MTQDTKDCVLRIAACISHIPGLDVDAREVARATIERELGRKVFERAVVSVEQTGDRHTRQQVLTATVVVLTEAELTAMLTKVEDTFYKEGKKQGEKHAHLALKARILSNLFK